MSCPIKVQDTFSAGGGEKPAGEEPDNIQTLTEVRRRTRGRSSWYLQASVGGCLTDFLVDSGAERCTITEDIYERIPEEVRPPIIPRTGEVFGWDGVATPVKGDAMITFVTPARSYTERFIVAEGRNFAALGGDWMRKYRLQFDWANDKLLLEEPLNESQEAKDIVYAVCLESEIEIPAKCEVVAAVHVDGEDGVVLLEPGPSVGNVLLGGVLGELVNGMTQGRLLNVGDEPVIIPAGRHVGLARRPVSVACCLDATATPVVIQDGISYEDCVKADCASSGVCFCAETSRIGTQGDCHLLTDNNSELDEADLQGSVEEKAGPVPVHVMPLYEATRDLSVTQRASVVELLNKHGELFVKSASEMGMTSLCEHIIDTGDAAPVRDAPRRLPLPKRLMVEESLQKLKELGVIRPSSSPWAACPVLVSKADGSTRWCVDWRNLNRVTVKDQYPLPRTDEALDSLAGASWFSCLDLQHGYYQVPLRREDWQKTAFRTHVGLFEFTRTPMGLVNSPATFQRLMEQVLAGLTWSRAILYLDDIVVPGKSFQEALDNLDVVLTRLSMAGLKVKTKKCALFQRSVVFLGHRVGGDGIRPVEAKVKTVKEWPTPRNVKDVRTFLGLVGYYRRFIHGFCSLAEPLTRLTRKDCAWQWGTEQQESFEQLKEALCENTVLAYPVEGYRYILDTDACNVGAGATLCQVHPDGTERPLMFWSKTWSAAERNYCTTRQELLAALLAMEAHAYYLDGVEFTLRTDHASLQWLHNFKNPDGQIARWLTRLARFKFGLLHRPGVRHGNADAMSRRPCVQCGLERHPGECGGISTEPETPRICAVIVEEEGEYPWSEPVLVLREQIFRPNSVSLPGIGHAMGGSEDLGSNQGYEADCELSECPDGYPDEAVADDKSGWVCDSEYSACKIASCPAMGGDSMRHDATSGVSRLQEVEPRSVQDSPGVIGNVVAAVETRGCKRRRQRGTVLPKSEMRRTPPPINAEAMLQAQNEDAVLRRVREWVDRQEKPPRKEMVLLPREARFFWHNFGALSIGDDGLLRLRCVEGVDDRVKVLVPEALRVTLMYHFHDDASAGHQGVNKTWKRIKSSWFYWPRMRKEVGTYVLSCLSCLKNKPRGQKKQGLLTQFPAGKRLERVGMDLIGPLPRTDGGARYILTVTDYFTRWCEGYPIPDKTAETVALTFMGQFVARYGCPEVILSDQGKEFDNALFHACVRLMETYKVRTSPYHAQCNGLTERLNGTVEQMLRHYVEENQRDWDIWLPFVFMAYRSAVQESLGVTPYEMTFGEEMPIPLDWIYGVPGDVPETAVEYIADMRRQIERAYETARRSMATAAKRQRRNYDSRVRPVSYNVGDVVMCHDKRRRIGRNPALQGQWTGPYIVVGKRSTVDMVIQQSKRGKQTVVHVDRLKKVNVRGYDTSWFKGSDEFLPAVGAESESPVGESEADPGSEVLAVDASEYLGGHDTDRLSEAALSEDVRNQGEARGQTIPEGESDQWKDEQSPRSDPGFDPRSDSGTRNSSGWTKERKQGTQRASIPEEDREWPILPDMATQGPVGGDESVPGVRRGMRQRRAPRKYKDFVRVIGSSEKCHNDSESGNYLASHPGGWLPEGGRIVV